jgi:hypothetical protein
MSALEVVGNLAVVYVLIPALIVSLVFGAIKILDWIIR